MDPIFRKAVPADAPEMARLIVLAWQKAYRGILSDELLDNRSADEGAVRIRTGMETKPELHYHVLELNGEIVGVSVICACKDNDLPDSGEVMVFYIHPDRQGQGLGKFMMRRSIQALQADGYTGIALWVLSENHAARAFYEKMGFRPDGMEKTMPNIEDAHTVRYQYAAQEML